MYPDSRFLSFRGMTVHYRLIVPPSATPKHRALLLASPGLSTYCWRFLVPELIKADCACVLCDLPGFGLSACGAGVPHRQSVRAGLLWGVLDEADKQMGGALSCWHLIAHGSAAGTCVEMALQQPDSVSSMFFVSPMLYSMTPRVARRFIASGTGERLLKAWYDRHLRSRRGLRKLAKRVYGRAVPERELAEIRKPLIRAGGDEALQRLLLEGYDVRMGDTRTLFAPVMVLWGGRDSLLGGMIPTKLRRDLPSAEYHVIGGAGHCAMETNSRAVCDYLRGWIAEMSGG